MIRDEHLDAAVARGILSAEQRAQLVALARAGGAAPVDARDETPPDPDDERFRLIGGFNDVFVTIGVGLLAAALIGLAGALGLGVWFTVLALLSAWALAEIFTARMRLALPSIALAVMFAFSGAHLVGAAGEYLANRGVIGGPRMPSIELMLMGLGAALAAVAHEHRFRVPIDTAIVAGGAVCVLSGALGVLAPEWARAHNSLLTALYGLAVFAAAVRIDARDPERKTRRADVAFWLHLLAAPMIVHAVMPLFAGPITEIYARQAVAVLAVFGLLGIVAVIIDRRALLVSGLTYAGVALSYLLSQGVDRGMGVALALLGLAVLVLGLSLGWRPLRRVILALLPIEGVRRYIPPAT